MLFLTLPLRRKRIYLSLSFKEATEVRAGLSLTAGPGGSSTLLANQEAKDPPPEIDTMPAKPHQLKAPQTPKNNTSQEQMFAWVSLRGTFHIQTVIMPTS